MLLLAVIAGGVVGADEATCGEVEYQTWIDFNPDWKAGRRVAFFGDVGVRRNYQDPRLWRFVLRPSLGYELGSWELAAGLGSFYSDFAGEIYIYELRPWQGLQLDWPSSPVELGHLFRLEERFFFDTDDGNSIFRLRFRYQIGTRVAWTTSESGRGWGSPFSVEAFFQFDDNAEERFGEQLRLTGGIERVFTPRLRIELDVLWQKTQRVLDLYADSELYLRLRVYQKF